MINPLWGDGLDRRRKVGVGPLALGARALTEGRGKETVRRTLDKAERSLELASAKLARDLGYPLCW